MKNRTFVFILLLSTTIVAQDFLMQGWYWDYPKTTSGYNWADTLNNKAVELANAGFTHIWLPPFSRASSGNSSNGYDPKDLYDLGEFGGGATGFGARTDVDNLITIFNNNGINAVADVVFNHRDGGAAETNTAVEGWIENFTSTKVNSGDNAYPSDRFRCVLPIGGATGKGAGTYYFKIRSASQHSNFYGKEYKFYAWTNTVGWQALADTAEVEPNGGGNCGQANNVVTLGRNFIANIDADACGIDEFALTLTTDDFNSAGDNIYIVLSNSNGNYSDHYIYGLWYTGTSSDIQADIQYQTYTDFTNMPSGNGSMNYMNFKPNGSATNLSGDWDWMWFFYDYDQTSASTQTALLNWSKWLWTDVGIRGYRMDAVKHFPPEFVGNLLDYLHTESIDPGIVVGEFYDSNPSLLKSWVDDVYSFMDAATIAAITPRIFDFSLRQALKDASDSFGNDVRAVFNAGIVDGAGGSGFNVVTFLNNHDFRDGDQPIQNDPILGYAYLLTNNQIGVPTVFYPDYYHVVGFSNGNLKNEINKLMEVHKNFIYGSSSRDYLSRSGTPYAPTFTTGFTTTTLVYQLMNTPKGKDVIVAINYAGEPLDVEIGINMTNVSNGDTFGDQIGNATLATTTVANSKVILQIPARSYSVWVQNTAPLPVELSSFTTKLINNHVVLNWRTETEVNNYGFEIEASTSSATDWGKIGFVEGHGNSNSPKEYSFIDNHNMVAERSRSYRLKQIDTDGNFEYSNISEISVSNLNKYFLAQNNPNPFNPATSISFTIPKVEHVNLKVFNSLGETVAELVNRELNAGEHSVIFDASNLSSGIYLYRLETDNFSQTMKMILMK
ncbi:MAG: T9SS type A sorting domain-containing protein [Bacteroidetes bacterium]|nr:T9SS type A sorting domain-containing protein [Bacteroidota bacterium]MBU1114647.1 T9SS type A sorting domain-containing protein [Bacteroidota bacterium]MBU1798191.1 T9SS type A sorting domain-containing protein [Bacteroidota bacterium]